MDLYRSQPEPSSQAIEIAFQSMNPNSVLEFDLDQTLTLPGPFVGFKKILQEL